MFDALFSISKHTGDEQTLLNQSCAQDTWNECREASHQRYERKTACLAKTKMKGIEVMHVSMGSTSEASARSLNDE